MMDMDAIDTQVTARCKPWCDQYASVGLLVLLAALQHGPTAAGAVLSNIIQAAIATEIHHGRLALTATNKS